MSISPYSDDWVYAINVPDEVWEKSIRMENQRYEKSHEKIATQCKKQLEAFGDSATPAVLDLAIHTPLEIDGYSYTVEQVLLNKVSCTKEEECLIADAFVNLFSGFQFELFKKGRILLYKDSKITITTGKPIGYDQEPLLWHRLNKIIDQDQCDGYIDLLNPSYRITWCKDECVWSLKQFRNFNGYGHTGLRNGSHMIIWANNGDLDYIKER
jgi:hypothetical protein